MAETYKYRTQHLRGTSSQWAELGGNIIPLAGEIVIEIDTDNAHPLHKLKIGDGIHKYSDLPYFNAGDETATQVLPRLVTITLYADAWGEPIQIDSHYYYRQKITNIDNIPTKSRLDLQPSEDIILKLKSSNITLTTKNIGGELFVCSADVKPTVDYTMQAVIIELITDEELNEIAGIPVGGGNNNIVVSEEAPTVTRETIWLQPLTTDTGAVDYIVESGIIDGDTGYYEKWNSGIVKYYAKITQEITSGNTTYTNTLSIPTTICKKVITHHITAANLSSAKKVEVIGGGVVESGTVLLLYYTLYFEAMAATVETSHTIIGTWK